MKTLWNRIAVGILILGMAGPAAAATPGVATFDVQLTQDGGKYSPKHVVAVWVTTSSGTFIKTLRRDGTGWSGEGTSHLNQWQNARAGSTVLDGYTGGTITTYNPFTVTWNCTNAAGVLAEDGDYKFWVEYADANAQGPYTAGGITWHKGSSAFSNSYPNQTYIKNMKVVFTPILIPHDIAVLSIQPLSAPPNTNATIYVTVTNKSPATETFTVTLQDQTTASLVGARLVNAMPGNAVTNLSYSWNTTGTPLGWHQLQAQASVVAGELNTADNTLAGSILVRSPSHNVGIVSMGPPLYALSNTANGVSILTTNSGDFVETFTVKLYDDTVERMVSSNAISSLSPFSSRILMLTWRTTNMALGYHTLRAVAEPVAGESNLADNTARRLSLVTTGLTTNTLIASGDAWRYGDTGLDLSGTPWRMPFYYDALWPAGPGPFGYGYPGLGTTNAFGPNANDRYTAYYYRRAFRLDVPLSSASLRFKRDDGIVVYLNGAEVARNNMPTGAVGFAALSVTNCPDSTGNFWITTSVSRTNFVVGANLIAAEVHQSATNSNDLLFDLELSAVMPILSETHRVDVTSLNPPESALAGDKARVSIALTNAGNATETVLVLLVDTLTGQTIATRTLKDLGPADATTVEVDWPTLGASNGVHMLQAYTVINGTTNFAGATSASTTISGSGFGLKAVPAASAVGGRCSAVAAKGNLLLVGAGATLEVWDRTQPNAPVRAGLVRLPALIESLAAEGNWAYAACGSAGVQFVDIRTPAEPLHRNTFDTSGHAYGVAVSGDYLYVADGASGLRVVHVRDPLSPSLAGVYYTRGPARSVAVAGAKAFVLDQHQGLCILDTANPAAPALLGSYTGLEAGVALAVAGNVVCVVDDDNHFLAVNVSNAALPTLSGSLLLTNMTGKSLVLSGTTAYVAAGDNGLVTIDLATPGSPALKSVLPTSAQAAGLALAGSTLYLANGFGGLRIYNVSSPLSPVLEQEQAIGLRGSDVVLAGDLAYVAGGEKGLRIFDFSRPPSPALLGVFGGATNARCLAISGSTACVGDGQYGLKIVSVSDPAKPSLLGTYLSSNLGFIRNVAAAGSRVILNDGQRLELVDIAVPNAPALTGFYTPPGFAHSLTVAGSKAYVACGDKGLVILDLSPLGPVLAGSYATPGPALGVSVSGTDAFVAMGSGGWLLLDVSNPAAPTLRRTFAEQGPVFDIAVSGVLATLANGANSAITVDLTTPLTPVSRRVFAPLLRSMRLSAQGTLAATAEDEAGLTLLSSGDDLDQDSMPDAWEQQMVQASLATNGPIRTIWDVRPGDDFDKDGLSNLAEYLAGTSPLDATSRLVLYVPQASGGLTVTIRWLSVPGKTYAIWKSKDLALPNRGFSLLQDNITATDTTCSAADNSGDSPAFYMISVR